MNGIDPKLLKKMMWGMVFGVAVYAIIAIIADFRGLMETAADFSLQVLGICLGLTVVNYFVRGLRWHAYMTILKFKVPFAHSLLVFCAGLSMSITPGKVGEVLKSALLLESHDLPPAKTAPMVLAERLTDLLGLVVIIAFGIAQFDYGRVVVGVTLALVVVFVLFVGQERLVMWLLEKFSKFSLVAKFSDKLRDAYESTKTLLSTGPLALATAMATFSWGMEAVSFYLIVQEIGGTASLEQAAFIFATATLIGGVSFLPGGLGATEGSMIGVLIAFGVFMVESEAVAATYVIRFTTLWFGVACGLVALLWFRRKRKNLAAKPQTP